ncbi:HNH endonuclease [Winogradskyella eximia]|uniref:HNH endonuclease n=1 Tax=Winogradskyella eximia TaxID=262006 RepID=A0A3D9GYU8_9FLAO|nr:HNH endonuclease [Winogradskyella eximia]RED42126.1 HNH endonuclease [Winogradskyella eximia]
MIRHLWKEQWKTVVFDDFVHPDEKYQLSNYGRLARIRNGKKVLFEPYKMHGYLYFKVKKIEKGKFKTYYLHKILAQHFLEQKDGVYVIHLDYDKLNNHIDNLKWVTKREKEIHQFSNPSYKRPEKLTSAKLSENDVRRIKKMLNDPNRRTRLKIIAKRFGVSTMQLQRIKTGENWGHVPSL